MKKSTFTSSGWLFTLPLAAGAVLYLMFLFLPAKKQIAELRATLAAQRKFIAGGESLRPVISQHQQQLDAVRYYNGRWRAEAPSEQDISQLFEQLNQSAQRSGTTTTRFDPTDPREMQTLRRFGASMGVVGSFEEIFKLLAEIEGLPQSIWLEEIRFQAQRGSETELDCEMKLSIFGDKLENLQSTGQARRSLPTIPKNRITSNARPGR